MNAFNIHTPDKSTLVIRVRLRQYVPVIITIICWGALWFLLGIIRDWYLATVNQTLAEQRPLLRLRLALLIVLPFLYWGWAILRRARQTLTIDHFNEDITIGRTPRINFNEIASLDVATLTEPKNRSKFRLIARLNDKRRYVTLIRSADESSLAFVASHIGRIANKPVRLISRNQYRQLQPVPRSDAYAQRRPK